MARPLRIEYSGAVYHVTSRGNARQNIFVDDEDRILFLAKLEGAALRHGFVSHSYRGHGVQGVRLAQLRKYL